MRVNDSLRGEAATVLGGQPCHDIQFASLDADYMALAKLNKGRLKWKQLDQ